MKAEERELQARLGSLWMDCRWLENAHRYYADLITGFMLTNHPAKLDPPQPCVPPKVCTVPIEDLKGRLDQLEEVSSRFRSELGAVIEDARRRGAEAVVFRPSQLPAFPQPKESPAAKPTPAAAR